MCQEKKEEDNSPALKNPEIIYTRTRKIYLKSKGLITAMAIFSQKERQQKLENKNGKKNNCMGTSSDKLARLHIRIPEHS